MLPKTIQKLINIFINFPGIGQRQATRFVFYLINQPKEIIDDFIKSIQELQKKIKLCQNCYYIAENNLCSFCSDVKRNKNLICVVEKETDVIALEKTKQYNGVYFVLGGTIFSDSPIIKERLNRLIEKVKNIYTKNNSLEIILAINPTTSGETTMLYLEKQLKSFNIKVSRLAKGLPIGGSMEYADEITLTNALLNRK